MTEIDGNDTATENAQQSPLKRAAGADELLSVLQHIAATRDSIRQQQDKPAGTATSNAQAEATAPASFVLEPDFRVPAPESEKKLPPGVSPARGGKPMVLTAAKRVGFHQSSATDRTGSESEQLDGLVRSIVEAELKGELGENFSKNLRKMIRQEVEIARELEQEKTAAAPK